ETAFQTRPDELAVRLCDVRRVVLHFTRAAAWLADLLTVIEHLADFLAAVEKMWLERTIYFAASPERKAQQRLVPTGNVIAIVEDITDRQVPVLVHVINKVVHIVRAGLVGVHLRNFCLAREERHLAAHQFIPHLDRKTDGPGVSETFVFRNAIAAAAFRLPPVAFLRLLRLAIELHPCAGAGHSEFRIELAAASDRPINAKLHFRHPTEGLEIAFVRTKRESRNLHRVFR